MSLSIRFATSGLLRSSIVRTSSIGIWRRTIAHAQARFDEQRIELEQTLDGLNTAPPYCNVSLSGTIEFCFG